jgi:hypothetical protein
MFTTYRGHSVDIDAASGLYVVQPYGVYVDDYRTWIDAHIAREQAEPTRGNPLVKFKTKSGQAISFNSRGHRKNPVDELCEMLEIEALENPKRRRKPAAKKPTRKPAAKKPAARRASKDKASYEYYVVFRGPPSGLNIHAGFASQKAARAYITTKHKGTRRLQVRGRVGLEKSGHDPKVAKNWKTFSLAASLKAAPAPRKSASKKFTRGYESGETGRRIARSAGKKLTPQGVIRLFKNMKDLEEFYFDLKDMGADALHEIGVAGDAAFARRVRAAVKARLDEYDSDSAHAKKIFRHLTKKKPATRKPAARKSTARSRTRRNGAQLPGLSYGGRSLAAQYGSYTREEPWETCIAAAERADNAARKASYAGDVAEAKRLRETRDAWLAQAETYMKKNRKR